MTFRYLVAVEWKTEFPGSLGAGIQASLVRSCHQLLDGRDTAGIASFDVMRLADEPGSSAKKKTGFHVTIYHDGPVLPAWINPQAGIQAAVREVFGHGVDVDVTLPQPSALCSHCIAEREACPTCEGPHDEKDCPHVRKSAFRSLMENRWFQVFFPLHLVVWGLFWCGCGFALCKLLKM